MKRIALLSTMVTLVTGSVGVWFLIGFSATAYKLQHPGNDMPAFAYSWASNRHLILVLPLAFIVWSLWLLRHRGPTLDQTVMFMALGALIFAALFFGAAVAMITPWATIVDR